MNSEKHLRPQRRFPAVLFALLAVLLAARAIVSRKADAASADPAETTAEPATFAQDRIHWIAHQDAARLSAQSGKPILYEFSAAWCEPCHELASEVFADKDAADYINAHFVPVELIDRIREDGQNIPAVARLQERYGINSLPTICVALPDGTLIGRYRGFAPGGDGRDRIVKFLKKAEEKAREVMKEEAGQTTRQ
jgi:thiol:disulfide interchange protein